MNLSDNLKKKIASLKSLLQLQPFISRKQLVEDIHAQCDDRNRIKMSELQ